MKIKFFIFLSIVSIFSLSVMLKGDGILSPQNNAQAPLVKIKGTNQTVFNCSVPHTPGSNIELEVDYTFSKSTEKYTMNSIPFQPEISFDNTSQLGNKVYFSGENMFSPAIEIFPFSFFDDTFEKVAIGENGLISFDEEQAGLINLRFPSANNPSPNLTRNSIFASHYDLQIHGIQGADVYHKQIGTFPARKFIVTYLNAQPFYCPKGERTSVQLVMEELTNEIKIYVKQKSVACGANVNAVLGIMDKYGTLGYSPQGRNYSDGNWTAKNEAWKFTPNGKRTPIIKWYSGTYSPNSPTNNQIGTGETIIVNGDLSAFNYTAEVFYPHYKDKYGEIMDNYNILYDNISVSDEYPIAKNQTVIACEKNVNLYDYVDFVSENPISNFNFEFLYNGNIITNPINYTLPSTDRTDIDVWVISKTNPNCKSKGVLSILSLNSIVSQYNQNVYVCDNVSPTNPKDIEQNLNVSILNNLIFSEDIPNADIYYYSSPNKNDRISLINVDTAGTQVYFSLSISSNNNNCESEIKGPITVNLYPPVGFKQMPKKPIINVCDKLFDYVEHFPNNNDWANLLAENGLETYTPNTDKVTVYETLEDATIGENEIKHLFLDINNPTYNSNLNSVEQTLYIKVENETGCYSIEKIEATIRFYGVRAQHATHTTICVEGTNSFTIDLSCFLQNADFNGNGNYTDGMFTEIYFADETKPKSSNINDLNSITYYENYTDALKGNNPVSEFQNVTTDKEYVEYFVRFLLCNNCDNLPHATPCFTVKKIRIILASVNILTDNIEVCKHSGNSQFVENLNIFNYQIVDNPSLYNIKYYISKEDAELNIRPFTQFEFTTPVTLWLKIERKGISKNSCFPDLGNSCTKIVPIKFKLGRDIEPIDFPEQTVENVCDNNSDGKEDFDITIFEKNIYSGNATFTYYKFLNENTLNLSGEILDPKNYLFDGEESGSATETVYVLMKYSDSGCSEIIKLTITINFLPKIKTTKGYLCDCLDTPGTYATFNLSSALKQMYHNENQTPLSDLNISYYYSYKQAEDGINSIPPNNVPNYKSTKEIENLYVKFQSAKTNCFTIDTLQLKNLILPNTYPGSIKICDTNFNGKYDIYLNQLNNLIMQSDISKYYFSYYWSYDDAKNNVNPIIPITTSVDPKDYFYEFETLIQKIYVKINADDGSCSGGDISLDKCNSIELVKINIGDKIELSQNIFDLPPICDSFNPKDDYPYPTYNDGISENINLVQLESLITSKLSVGVINKFIYYDSLEKLKNDFYPYNKLNIKAPVHYTNIDDTGKPVDKVFVRLLSDDKNCPEYVQININIIKGPEVKTKEFYYICPGGLANIKANFPEYYNLSNYLFTWTLADGSTSNSYELNNIKTPGRYSLVVEDLITGCKTPLMRFNLIEIEQPEIIELIVTNEDTVEVIANWHKGLEVLYSIDGVNWVDSNIFDNLTYGVYTFYVKYKTDETSCISEPKSTVLFKFNNVITPNGDGYNDKIIIENLDVFGENVSTFRIMDRNGKTIFCESSNKQIIWDGYYNNRKLPTTDYWYVLTTPDGRKKTGRISLKNQ